MTRQMLTANLPFNFSNRPIFVGIVVIILQLLLARLQLAHDALQDESRSVDTDAMDLYDIISGDRIRRPSMSSATSSTNTGRIVTSVVSTSTDRDVIRKLATSDQAHHLAVFSGIDQSNDVELSEKIGGDDTSEYQSDESSYIKPDMISVSAQRFHDRLRRPDATYRDVIRIFLKYGDSMSDDEVDDVIISHVKSHTPQRKTMAATGRLHMGEPASKNADDAENRLVDRDNYHNHFCRGSGVTTRCGDEVKPQIDPVPLNIRVVKS